MRRGDFREGRSGWQLRSFEARRTRARAREGTTRAAAMLASQQSDLEVADSPGHEVLALFRELGDQGGVGWMLNARLERDGRGAYGEARRLYEEAADGTVAPATSS